MQANLQEKATKTGFQVNLIDKTPIELEKPLSYFEKACKYGYGDSCSFLGMHYLKKGNSRVILRYICLYLVECFV
mgnify:CR=1 FL=1